MSDIKQFQGGKVFSYIRKLLGKGARIIHLSHHDNLKKIKASEGDTITVSLAFSPQKGYRWKESVVVSLKEMWHEHTALVNFVFRAERAGFVTLCYEDGTKWFEVEIELL